jgi:hypothetical protein
LNPEAFFDKRKYDTLDKIVHFNSKKWLNNFKAVTYIKEQPLFNRLLKK